MIELLGCKSTDLSCKIVSSIYVIFLVIAVMFFNEKDNIWILEN
jgi:hypothetical protein